jgi:hypothetical protein
VVRWDPRVTLVAVALAFSGCSDSPNPDPSRFRNLMELRSHSGPPETWIDNASYQLLLGELKVLPDPTILDISGMVTRGGVVTIKRISEFPEGKVSPTHGGKGFAVVVLGPNDEILAEHEGSENFDVPTSDPRPMSWSTLPIGLSIEYPPSATAVEFRRGGTVLLRIDPLAWSLRTAIQSIPDRGFEKNPTERRKALLAKVDAIEEALGDRAYQGVLQQLDQDLRNAVSKWLLPTYADPKPLESTQSSVLDKIDRVKARLIALKGAGR